MNEIDIWRTAKILIEAHGEKAWMEASRRADDAIADANAEAESVWKRILAAVLALQARPDGTPLN